MPSIVNAEDLLTVIRVISTETGDDRPPEDELLEWTTPTWSRVLLHIPVDAHTFRGRFDRSWDHVIDDLERWCGAFRGRPASFQEHYGELFGYLGLLLVTLVSLRQ